MHHSRPLLSCFATLTVLWVQAVSAGTLESPPCEELAAWSSTVDGEDRWTPFPENPRIWLPSAMSTPTFDALFGKPPLQWSQADVVSARSAWNGCIQQAKKRRNREQQATLSSARRYLTGNLRNAVRYQERRASSQDRDDRHQAARAPQQRAPVARPPARAAAGRTPTTSPVPSTGLDAAVSRLVAAPPSVESLIALGLLSRIDVNDADALQELERRFGTMPGEPATKATYRLLRELRIRGTTGFDTSALPRIDARLEEVKPVVLEGLRKEFSQNTADIQKRRALAQRYEAVMADLKDALSDEEWRSLADETRKERRAVVDEAVANAKAQIDRAPPGGEGIAAVDRIVEQTAARGLDAGQRKDLLAHARTRQQALADERLKRAVETELPALPETWAGLEALNALNSKLVRAVDQKASFAASEAYVAALNARLARIGRTALAEYEARLADLADDETGLAEAKKQVADMQAWTAMDESVRRDYVAAAEQRRDQIAAIVDEERAQRRAAVERERQRAIAAGADPRLVGYQWVDENGTMQLDFRDQETVFVNVIGLRFAGIYRVSRDDVVVKGPHGQLVYTLDGDRLIGMGAVFRRRAD